MGKTVIILFDPLEFFGFFLIMRKCNIILQYILIRRLIMSYESSYSSARNRYYNACSEINRCENRISELKTQRQQKINQINQLKTDIKNHQEALESVTQIIRNEESLNAGFLGITNKTSDATDNFCGMVISSDVTNKNLTEVYNCETTRTKSTLTNIFDNLRAKKNELTNKITDLQNQLRTAESELQDIESAIRTTELSLQEWKRVKSNASLDMAYYRRKMNEESAS